MIGGSTERTNRRPRPGAGGSATDVPSWSSPATTARSSARFAVCTSVAMTADLSVELGGDLGGQRADGGGLDGARVADVDAPLAHDAARPRAHEHDPLAQPHGLADVV